MDGWNTILSFWDGLFSVAVLVLEKGTPLKTNMTNWKILPFLIGNTVHPHSWWIFQPVMLVLGGVNPNFWLMTVTQDLHCKMW